jgi:glycosyltransferase involved in cell wall biosynthesis
MAYDAYISWRDNREESPTLWVVPTHNESERLIPTVAAIAAHVSGLGEPWEMIISDSASTDGTPDLGRSLGFADLRVLSSSQCDGKGAGVARGMLAARGDYVLFADADGSTPISVIDGFLEAVRADKADVVIASRAHLTDEANRYAIRCERWLASCETCSPSNVDVLRRKYRTNKIALVPHGSFEKPPLPTFDARQGEPQGILAFGKFGTYKRVEDLIRAYRELSPSRDLELIIAGSDSPNAPGYLQEVQSSMGGEGIIFTGYVEATHLPDLFARGAVAVIESEGYCGEFFEPGNPGDMARTLALILADPTHRADLGRRNYLASRGLPIDEVAGWYLLHASPQALSTSN